jgi:hypothetical protein
VGVVLATKPTHGFHIIALNFIPIKFEVIMGASSSLSFKIS